MKWQETNCVEVEGAVFMHLLLTFLSFAAAASAMQFSFKQDLVISLESSSHLECIQFEFHLKNGLGSIVECVADAAAADDKKCKNKVHENCILNPHAICLWPLLMLLPADSRVVPGSLGLIY